MFYSLIQAIFHFKDVDITSINTAEFGQLGPYRLCISTVRQDALNCTLEKCVFLLIIDIKVLFVHGVIDDSFVGVSNGTMVSQTLKHELPGGDLLLNGTDICKLFLMHIQIQGREEVVGEFF